MKATFCFVFIFNNPSKYPPTLNAVGELCKLYEKVFLFSFSEEKIEWRFPSNCVLKSLSKYSSIRNRYIRYLMNLIDYVRSILKVINVYQPEIAITYDPPATAFFFVLSNLNKRIAKVKWWYHNHDVLEKSEIRKFSLNWIYNFFENKIFRSIDIFSLPSVERKKYFPLKGFMGKFLFIPNYPSLAFYNQYQESSFFVNHELRLIYQGSLGVSHGFEYLIQFVNKYKSIDGKEIKLVLLGPINGAYKLKLTELIRGNPNILILDPIEYKLLPSFTATFDIGLATHIPDKIIYATGGTASNKIYEYIALGLPVILYDCPNYRNILENYDWAHFTDFTDKSLKEIFKNIIKHYSLKSQSALMDFTRSMNYEKVFTKSISQIIEK